MDEKESLDKESLRKKAIRTGNNIAGTGMQATGKTMKVAGTGAKYAGTGVKYTGKGVSKAGSGLMKAGSSLSSTGVGALLGVPMAALGAASKVAGEGAKVAGKGAEKIGNATNKAGSKIDSAGKKVADAGKKVDDKGKEVKSISSFLKKRRKRKLISFIISIGISLFFLLFNVIILLSPLIALGIIDIDFDIGSTSSTTTTSTSSYSDTAENSSYWWPIGSSETEEIDGNVFASDIPVDSSISSYFAGRIDPFTGAQSTHSGIDITSDVGYNTNIIASKDGIVTYPSDSDTLDCVSNGIADSCGEGYGNFVMISHYDGTVTLYGHMYENSITVRKGDIVKQGQVIGKMGSSGRSTGAHLHFEVRVNGERIDPMTYVDINKPRPMVKER